MNPELKEAMEDLWDAIVDWINEHPNAFFMTLLIPSFLLILWVGTTLDQRKHERRTQELLERLEQAGCEPTGRVLFSKRDNSLLVEWDDCERTP